MWYENHPFHADAVELIKVCLGENKNEIWHRVVIDALRELSTPERCCPIHGCKWGRDDCKVEDYIKKLEEDNQRLRDGIRLRRP